MRGDRNGELALTGELKGGDSGLVGVSDILEMFVNEGGTGIVEAQLLDRWGFLLGV